MREDTPREKRNSIWQAVRWKLVVLLEESVLESESGNSATGQSSKEVDPNLNSDKKAL